MSLLEMRVNLNFSNIDKVRKVLEENPKLIKDVDRKSVTKLLRYTLRKSFFLFAQKLMSLLSSLG